MLSTLQSRPYYVAAGLVACYAFARLLSIGRRARNLPPGPPTVPVLGNLHLFPKEFINVAFTKWAREFGDIFSLKMANGTAVVLTSVEAARELLDRRSATTVDRPKNFVHELVTGSKNIVLSNYTEEWRALRRTAHAALTPQASSSHLPIQLAESAQLLHDILHDPENFYTHIRREATSIILSVLYGRRAPRFGTQEVTGFYHVQDLWTRALDPGAVPPVDLLPILGYVPERWAPWKTTCREVRALQRALYFRLLGECETRLAEGRHVGCFMEDVIERREEFGLTRELAGYLGGALIEGGSDTTSTYLQSFVLALLAHPEAQRKAQEEMDRVVGQERAPTLEDVPMLPYLQAVVKEVHRWRPVTPFGVPHAALEDEWYKGYLIPQGSTIFVNQWGILHDEKIYERPDAFEPERWLKNEFGVREGVDTAEFRTNLEFGYGRRICPGMHVAKNTIAINTSRLIWAFNFEPAAGKAEDVDTTDYVSGIITFPSEFKAKITPRSKQIAEIIDHEFLAASPDFERYETLLSTEDKAHVQITRGAYIA